MLRHHNNIPWFTADFDSSSGLVKALANCFHDKSFAGVGSIPGSQILGRLMNFIPSRFQKNIYIYGSAKGAINPEKLRKVDSGLFSHWVTKLYPKRKYPALFLGSPNGSIVHLAAAMDAPWLPQTFLIPVKIPSGLDVDEPLTRLEWGRDVAKPLLSKNPDLQLHHMMDPNQDRPMLKKISYFRVKQIRLADAYKKFILDNLLENGILYIADCRKMYPVTKVDDRHYFQFGGLGGTTIDEYLNGGEEVKKFLKRMGSRHEKWECPAPTEEMPESEWGFERTLMEDIHELAQKHGFMVKSVSFDEPESLSPFVADLYRAWYMERGITYNQLIVGTFFLMDPYWTLRTGSIPFWTAFNGKASADFLKVYLEKNPPFNNIYLLPFSHGIKGMGLASEKYLRSILFEAMDRGEFIGAEPGKYPFDYGIYFRFEKDLQKKISTRINGKEKLDIGWLEEFIKFTAGKYNVEWKDLL